MHAFEGLCLRVRRLDSDAESGWLLIWNSSSALNRKARPQSSDKREREEHEHSADTVIRSGQRVRVEISIFRLTACEMSEINRARGAPELDMASEVDDDRGRRVCEVRTQLHFDDYILDYIPDILHTSTVSLISKPEVMKPVTTNSNRKRKC